MHSLASGFVGFTFRLGGTAAVVPRVGALLACPTGATRLWGGCADSTHEDPRVATWRAAPRGYQTQVHSTKTRATAIVVLLSPPMLIDGDL